MTPMRLKPTASGSRVKHSTTESLRKADGEVVDVDVVVDKALVEVVDRAVNVVEDKALVEVVDRAVDVVVDWFCWCSYHGLEG